VFGSDRLYRKVALPQSRAAAVALPLIEYRHAEAVIGQIIVEYDDVIDQEYGYS
jgi:hypothetical protein